MNVPAAYAVATLVDAGLRERRKTAPPEEFPVIDRQLKQTEAFLAKWKRELYGDKGAA